MTENKNVQLLKVSMLLLAVVTLVYGFMHLFIPEIFVKIQGGDPISPTWLRWFGGILICPWDRCNYGFSQSFKTRNFCNNDGLSNPVMWFNTIYILYFLKVLNWLYLGHCSSSDCDFNSLCPFLDKLETGKSYTLE